MGLQLPHSLFWITMALFVFWPWSKACFIFFKINIIRVATSTFAYVWISCHMNCSTTTCQTSDFGRSSHPISYKICGLTWHCQLLTPSLSWLSWYHLRCFHFSWTVRKCVSAVHYRNWEKIGYAGAFLSNLWATSMQSLLSRALIHLHITRIFTYFYFTNCCANANCANAVAPTNGTAHTSLCRQTLIFHTYLSSGLLSDTQVQQWPLTNYSCTEWMDKCSRHASGD